MVLRIRMYFFSQQIPSLALYDTMETEEGSKYPFF